MRAFSGQQQKATETLPPPAGLIDIFNYAFLTRLSKHTKFIALIISLTVTSLQLFLRIRQDGRSSKFTYRGVDLDQLLDMSYEQLMQLYSARQRWRLNRGLRRKQHYLLQRLRKAKKEAPPMEKPEVVKTHLRDMIILPEMVGSMVGVHNGKTFNQVEVKPEMIGHYLGEFSITYKPVKQCRSGIGATHSFRFIPLK
ncbi:small ribosomal subunit protein uS19-like [Pan paniscus]|uniref:small ribosomal subunit protein uS19-like n=1 Tax=Pan paniscus TaxID=9597 RepID=UPI003005B5D4